MNKKTWPKVKKFIKIESSEHVSVLFEGHNESLVFSHNRLALINLMDGTRDIKSLWDELQLQKNNIRLSEIYLTLERLKKAGALEGASESGYFAKSWLDYSIFKLRICSEIKTKVQSKAGFIIFSASVLLGALGSVFFSYYDLKVHGYLQTGNSYFYSIPLLILIFSVLGIIKGLIKSILILLGSGSWPATALCYRGLMFDLEVDESTILIEGALFRRLYQLTKAFCFLFIGAAAMLMIRSDLGRQMQITALLMTFVWLNPLRKSEFSQAVSSFFDDEEIRHLIPFLRNKSLSVFRGKNSLAFEKKLIVFSSLSLLWIFLFFDFTESLISANYGFWYSALLTGSFIEKLGAGLLALAIISLFVSLLLDLLKTIFMNIFSHFSGKINKFLQYKKPVDSVRFDRTQLVKFFSKLAFFSDLSAAQLQQLVSVVKLKTYPRATPIILEGDVASEMFLLMDGQVRVEKETASGFRQQFAVLNEGAIFGEIGLLENRERTADVIADTAVTLAILTKENFNAVFAGDQTLPVAALKQKILLSRYLANSVIFKSLPLETMQLFIEKGTFQTLDSATKIVSQGSLEKDFYLLLEGQVEVRRDGSKLNELQQGDFFGEIALFQNTPRTADVITTAKCTLLKLNKDAFWKALAENMELTFNLEIVSQNRSGSY